MKSDLEVIRQLESLLGRKFEEVAHESLCHSVGDGTCAQYSTQNGRIAGLKLQSSRRSDKLTLIPDPVFDLHGLRYLSLAWNNIKVVDPRVQNLQELESLNLYFNGIRTIPKDIALGRLVPTTDNPAAIFSAGKILLDLNPLESPPVEIIRKGPTAIADYFDSIGEDSRPLHEVKTLLIGHGAAGKTSVVRKLLGERFNKKEPTTHGIRIHPWKVKHDGTELKVNVWDFGGQEMMHSTHQFFLSKRSLYLVVLDGRKEEDPEYWLNYVSSFGGDSPVIVVLNKMDENPGFEVDRKFLQEKYPNIVGFQRTSCATGEGVDELRDVLVTHLAGLDHIKTTWPKSWFEVKQALEKLKKDYITYDAFVELCTAQGIEEEGQRVLVDFLNDLGVIVHFDDPLLRETNVIRPEWVTSAVYVIVTSPRLAEARGILPRASVSRMLSAKKYPKHKHDYILELMEKFELCFFLESEPDTMLVPALLPPNQPEFDFDVESSLAFVFEYDFLPPSVIHKFIVKMNRVIRDGLHWRKGVVLRDPDFESEAMVRVDERDNRIQVFVNGSRRRDFFAVIYKVFCDVHGAFTALGERELVPLPGTTKYFADYQGLLGLEEMGVEEYVEGRLRQRFPVRELLNGIEHERYRTGKQWDVFLSYSTNDHATVTGFATRLKREGVRYWLDSEQILPGDPILSKIENGLENSDALVAFFSRNQLESSWCRQEYEAVLADRLGKRSDQRVIPVMLDDIAVEDLPITLRSVRCISYDDDSEMAGLVDLLRDLASDA